MHPELFSTHLFGLLKDPWELHTYGLLIASGFLLGMMLAKRQAERENEDAERVVDLAFYLLLAGLVGARLVFILTKLDDFAQHPLQVFMFWRGGLVWYGGFIGASLYVWWYTRKHRLPFFKYVDIFVPYMALAHTFGRLGCLASGCCFGSPSTKPWAIQFPVGSMAYAQQLENGVISRFAQTLPVHPTQLYEAGAELLMFWVLLGLRPVKRFHGQLFLVWLSAYPILRTTIELFRGDSERGVYFLLSTSQYISIGVTLAAIALAIYLRSARSALAI
jgi:phosphatidylglycerol:prolipoprotein diacylglycerol transferase